MNIAANDIGSPEAVRDKKVTDWVEAEIGGVVERCERQPRWRGGWWVDTRKDGELIKLYVREERLEDFPPWPLEHEAGVLQILERHGIPVPHVYGIISDPHCIVMEMLEGEYDFAKVSAKEQLSVLEHYAEVCARMHAIDPRELVALGVKMPETPEEISLGCFALCEDMFVKGKQRPEPRIEFLRQWVRRNIPRHRNKVSIVAVDSGQFLFKDGKVIGLYDFEYGCLGDPMIDIAFIPLRLGMYNVGDMRPFFKRYGELTGETFELDVLTFHATWWGLCTPFILTAAMHQPPASATYFEYVAWYIGAIASKCALLADLKGLDVEHTFAVREETPTRWAQLFDVMAMRVAEVTPNEPYATLEQRNFLEFSRRVDAHPEVEQLYLDDVSALLGRRMANWRQADAELEKFVLAAGPEHDDALIALFYRWSLAQAFTFIRGLLDLPMFHRPPPRLSEMVA